MMTIKILYLRQAISVIKLFYEFQFMYIRCCFNLGYIQSMRQCIDTDIGGKRLGSEIFLPTEPSRNIYDANRLHSFFRLDIENSVIGIRINPNFISFGFTIFYTGYGAIYPYSCSPTWR